MAYRAVFFDLFDTLVRFERDRLPEITIKGKTVRSTAGHLHAVLARHVPQVTLDACYEALLVSWKEAERLRAIDHREVTARERFSFFFPALGLEAAALPRGLDEMLIEAHRHELAKAASVPPHHRPLLQRLAHNHCLAVVSNFDYSPTAIGILEAAGVRDLFTAIVVSDEVGWRKPRPDIFHEALRRAGVEPHATLFVGDRIDIDVVGAHAVGMDAAWINPGREALPAGVTPPIYEIRDLAELEAIVARG
jgi:HAD superfamily hydrolase (TIGR01509 family)